MSSNKNYLPEIPEGGVPHPVPLVPGGLARYNSGASDASQASSIKIVDSPELQAPPTPIVVRNALKSVGLKSCTARNPIVYVEIHCSTEFGAAVYETVFGMTRNGMDFFLNTTFPRAIERNTELINLTHAEHERLRDVHVNRSAIIKQAFDDIQAAEADICHAGEEKADLDSKVAKWKQEIDDVTELFNCTRWVKMHSHHKPYTKWSLDMIREALDLQWQVQWNALTYVSAQGKFRRLEMLGFENNKDCPQPCFWTPRKGDTALDLRRCYA